MLAEGPEPEQVAVACRFLAHMLSVLRCADRLYGSAVQAAVQLAAEVEQDVQEMLRLGADPRRREQVSVQCTLCMCTCRLQFLFQALVSCSAAWTGCMFVGWEA